ncbi:protein kinase domain-containing protein [Dokdonella sp.]|uniref:serine/threonine-protein kinase n=1 Tax=Dokdonella sp. TaxID=2291710 RepID=UPI00378475F0
MDTTARWLRIKQLFHDAQAMPAHERDAWLVAQCAGDGESLAEARALLAAQPRAPDILDDGAAGVLRSLHGVGSSAHLIGQRIGAYRLLRLVGEGGMGSVFLAEREDAEFTQRVALKLVRNDTLGEEAKAGFLRERSLLARLVHPHIAQLHDGGVAPDGTPYFTLEYVEGEPIVRYCDQHRLGLRARLRLALQVCSAIEYAHRNLVVHRDIKPSNILVTAEGEAKLLDFGIAKLIDPDVGDRHAATQSRMMTPQYAAPEQVLGDAITTATDVYAIGVLVYELCSAHLPYARAEEGSVSWSKAVVEDGPETLQRALDRDDADAAEAIAEARGATKLSLRRGLRGDLDRIVRRALAKAPEERYPSVAALAADLRRYVEGRPVSGGSKRYLLRMFVRRHWLPLGAAAAMLLTLLGSGLAVVSQAREKERAAQTTLAVKDFLYGLFTAVDPHEAKGRDISARELVDRGAGRIERADMDATQKAEIEATLGRLYYQLGAFDRANALQGAAAKVLADDPSQALAFARVEAARAETLAGNGDFKEAAPLAMDASARMVALEAAPVDRARALHAQATTAIGLRRFDEARRYAQAELGLARSVGDMTDTLFEALMTSGGSAWGLSDINAAIAYFSEAETVASLNADPDDLDVARARMNMAMAMQARSRYAEALQVDLLALATYEKVLGDNHPLTMAVRRDVGLAHHHRGEYAKARVELERVLAAQRAKLGNDNPAIAGTDINYGLTLVAAGDLDAGERAEREALDIFEKKYGREFQGARIALGNLAIIHMQRGDFELAAKEINEVHAQEQKEKAGEMETFMTTYRLGELNRLRGDARAAVPLQRQALKAVRSKNEEGSRYVAMVHDGLGLALRDAGDVDGAIPELRAALASYAGYLPNAEHPLAADVRYDLGKLLIARPGDRAEGLRLLGEAAALRERFLGADDPRTRAAREALQRAGHG